MAKDLSRPGFSWIPGDNVQLENIINELGGHIFPQYSQAISTTDSGLLLLESEVAAAESELLLVSLAQVSVDSQLLIIESEVADNDSAILLLESEMSQAESRLLVLESEMSEVKSVVLKGDYDVAYSALLVERGV